MKVAFFVREFPVVSETFILNQMTGLLDRGHEVVVFSERRPRPGPVHDSVSEYGLDGRTFYLDGAGPDRPAPADLVSAARLALKSPRALLKLRKKSAGAGGGRLQLLRLFASLSSAGHPDVLHAHFGTVALRSRFARILWPVPFVASFYGYDCSVLPQMRGRDIYQPLFATATRVTVLSTHMRTRLLALGCPPNLVREHHIGVDVDAFRFRPRGTDLEGRSVRLLTVARLVEKKGVEYALRAVARTIAAGADLRYTIVGDGPLRAELETLSVSLGIASRVEFRGSADQTVVRSELDAADLFLLPSVTASNGDQEGTPTVLMEAGAAGVPVLSTLHAGIPEVVRDGVTGRLVPERDVDALAEALGELLADPGRWATMGRAARDHVETHYNVRTLVADLVKSYGDLVAEGSQEPSASART